MGLLARREHSRKELAYKLAGRGFGHEEITETLDALEAERLLSDARFAESYVRSRSARGFGPLRIRLELQERGVDEALIEQYIAEAEEDWTELARAQHRKRFGSQRPADFNERAKQARFLQGRGFPSDIIHRVLNELK